LDNEGIGILLDWRSIFFKVRLRDNARSKTWPTWVILLDTREIFVNVLLRGKMRERAVVPSEPIWFAPRKSSSREELLANPIKRFLTPCGPMLLL